MDDLFKPCAEVCAQPILSTSQIACAMLIESIMADCDDGT
jgi:hypothetical protein